MQCLIITQRNDFFSTTWSLHVVFTQFVHANIGNNYTLYNSILSATYLCETADFLEIRPVNQRNTHL